MEDNAYNCWGCKHIVLDLARGYVCTLTGKVIADRADRYAINKAANCKQWQRI